MIDPRQAGTAAGTSAKTILKRVQAHSSARKLVLRSNIEAKEPLQAVLIHWIYVRQLDLGTREYETLHGQQVHGHRNLVRVCISLFE